MISLFKA